MGMYVCDECYHYYCSHDGGHHVLPKNDGSVLCENCACNLLDEFDDKYHSSDNHDEALIEAKKKLPEEFYEELLARIKLDVA